MKKNAINGFNNLSILLSEQYGYGRRKSDVF